MSRSGYERRLGHSSLAQCDLPLACAREWGLYISTSRGTTSLGIEEPALFSEPGVFVVLTKTYPARGDYAGAV